MFLPPHVFHSSSLIPHLFYAKLAENSGINLLTVWRDPGGVVAVRYVLCGSGGKPDRRLWLDLESGVW
ncbi:MAG TPA: hypothetical protein V6D10_12475 [Trichocoleus sp.]